MLTDICTEKGLSARVIINQGPTIRDNNTEEEGRSGNRKT